MLADRCSLDFGVDFRFDLTATTRGEGCNRIRTFKEVGSTLQHESLDGTSVLALCEKETPVFDLCREAAACAVVATCFEGGGLLKQADPAEFCRGVPAEPSSG